MSHPMMRCGTTKWCYQKAESVYNQRRAAMLYHRKMWKDRWLGISALHNIADVSCRGVTDFHQ